jgi:hypothetical protein
MFDKCKQYKKVVLISIIMLIAISLALYFSPTRKLNSSSKKGTTQSTGTAEQKKEEQKKQEAQKVNQDAAKTETLKTEKEVINGQIYVQNNTAIATMIIKDGVSEADAKALADKYAKQLKEQYKDMKINVQAVQKGKNIANITIEK